jgi:hypothetical protein
VIEVDGYLTPAAIATRLGLAKPDPVFAWIKSGELRAINVATKIGGRPTWRIDQVDFQTFLEARRSHPNVRQSPVARRRRPERATRYF